jgi:hypothetical protein
LVALPYSLEELENTATKLFGKHGALRFHKGETGRRIQSYEELRSSKNGEKIVVTWDDRKLTPAEMSYLLSSYQVDYPHHPVQPVVKARNSEMQASKVPLAALAKEDHYEEASSLYQDSFQGRRCVLEKNPARPSRAAPMSLNFKTGDTTYKELYTHHPGGSKSKAYPEAPGGLAVGRARWHEGSTYNTHYQWYRPKEPLSAEKRRKEDDLPQRLPFEGVSSYMQNFATPATSRPRTSCRPSSPIRVQMPTSTETEYHKEFVERSPDLRVHVSLEPAREKSQAS